MPIPSFSETRSVQRTRQAGRKFSDAVPVPKGTTVKEPIWPIEPDFTAEDKQEMKVIQIRMTCDPEVLVLRELLRAHVADAWIETRLSSEARPEVNHGEPTVAYLFKFEKRYQYSTRRNQ
jgi:hypothetical protein